MVTYLREGILLKGKSLQILQDNKIQNYNEHVPSVTNLSLSEPRDLAAGY